MRLRPLATSVGSLRESVGELREKLPSVKEGDVPKLIAVLEGILGEAEYAREGLQLGPGNGQKQG